jgi:hypothetical protein
MEAFFSLKPIFRAKLGQSKEKSFVRKNFQELEKSLLLYLSINCLY